MEHTVILFHKQDILSLPRQEAGILRLRISQAEKHEMMRNWNIHVNWQKGAGLWEDQYKYRVQNTCETVSHSRVMCWLV